MRMLGELLVPHRCLGCDLVRSEAGLCGACAVDLARLALPAAAVDLAEGVRAVGAYAYDGVAAEAVRAIKVRGGWAGAGVLGVLMRGRLGLPAPGRGVAWTWVPATARRRRQRGFDLPELLAGPDARPLLVRPRQRRDQTDLDAPQRRRALAGAFAPLGHCPPAVVLIDDVRTTGATALAAASALQAGGARRVLVATFAVGGSEAVAAARRR